MDRELQIGLKAYWSALGYQAERCCLSSNMASWCMLLHHRRIENKDIFFLFFLLFFLQRHFFNLEDNFDLLNISEVKIPNKIPSVKVSLF